MSILQESFGRTHDGIAVDLYTLTNRNGLRVKIMTYGATITSVETPDRYGKIENITLSLDTFQDYLQGHPHLGSIAGRYANRIARGKFSLGGKQYTLAVNNGENHLHGGIKGFDKIVWKAQSLETADSAGVVFTLESPDGDEGYPGTLNVKTIYTLTNDDKLKMEYFATTDKPTIVNLTNHAYWNLTAATDDVLGHELWLNADRYLPVDQGMIPLGQLRLVKDTPLDFTRPNAIGSRIEQVEGGYDHCYVLNKKPGEESGDCPNFRGHRPGTAAQQWSAMVDENGTVPFAAILAAIVHEPTSGRVMEVYTTEPGLQFYSGNFLDGTKCRGGKAFAKHDGFCLEAQHFPDSPNPPSFPSTLLTPGETYTQKTVHQFSLKG